MLDTKALSAAAEREPSALEVVARAVRLAIPVIVLGEYRLGIAQSRQGKLRELAPGMDRGGECARYGTTVAISGRNAQDYLGTIQGDNY